MKERLLQNISDRLSTMYGHAYFRPEDGPLKAQLTDGVLDAMDGDLAEQLAEEGFDLEVSVGVQEGESELSLGYKVDRPGVIYDSQIALNLLSEAALSDLAGYLERLGDTAPAAEAAVAGKTVLRKKPDTEEHHEKTAAAARLKVSPEWLKSVVPCTDYSYDEIDGKKYIREYFWSKELIERLFRIKSTKTTPEDLQYVAKECCDGDLEWAKDLIARLKSPNRPEPAAKGEKGQGQGKAQGQSQGQGQGRTVQTQGRGAVDPNRQAQAKAAPGERARSRSRHRKPFRDQGKDAGQKPGPAPGQKPPQN